MKRFKYAKLGQARMVPSDQADGPGVPIPGNYVYGVGLARAVPGGSDAIGAVQENPCLKGEWRAVVSVDGKYPPVNFKRGLWSMTPGRSGFRTRKEAATWLLGVHDARQAWFTEAIEEGTTA